MKVLETSFAKIAHRLLQFISSLQIIIAGLFVFFFNIKLLRQQRQSLMAIGKRGQKLPFNIINVNAQSSIFNKTFFVAGIKLGLF